MLYNEPLSPAMYRKFVDLKYRADAEHIIGWALRDRSGRVRAWHPRELGTAQWSSAADAYRAFVPDTHRRHTMDATGWRVQQTEGLEALSILLHRARGERADHARRPNVTDEPTLPLSDEEPSPDTP